MASLFTRIVQGEISCHKICEDQRFLAFLDIRPINPGHTLVIPKQEVDYFFDLADPMIGDIMVFAKRVAAAVKQEADCRRVGIMVAGLEVPHAHVHLVPINTVADLNFSKATPAEDVELAEMAARIRKHL